MKGIARTGTARHDPIDPNSLAATCGWRIVAQAAMGSWYKPRQYDLPWKKLRSALRIMVSPQNFDGLSPSSEVWMR